jgi:hypothetical protein
VLAVLLAGLAAKRLIVVQSGIAVTPPGSESLR